jgi:hypothetical protein
MRFGVARTLAICLVFQQRMKRITLLFGERTLEILDEMAAALAELDGQKPTRSHVLRLGVAALRKRMTDDGMLRIPGISADNEIPPGEK